MSNLITSMCDDCKYVKYSFDGGSTKCGYRGKKDCNFIPREKKDLAKEDFESIKETVISSLDNKIKSEAIKNFAERLKERLNTLEYTRETDRKTVPTDYFVHMMNDILHETVPCVIDSVLKEMTEESE